MASCLPSDFVIGNSTELVKFTTVQSTELVTFTVMGHLQRSAPLLFGVLILFENQFGLEKRSVFC